MYYLRWRNRVTVFVCELISLKKRVSYMTKVVQWFDLLL